MVSYGCWLAAAVATVRAETVTALFTVLQGPSSTADSCVSLAWPTQLSPSHAPSSGRAPLSLGRASSRMGGSSATTEPGPLPPKKLAEALSGYVWAQIYEQ